MKNVFQTVILLLFTLTLSAQSISNDKLSQIAGLWYGSLTYTDYQDDKKQFSLDTELNVKWKNKKGKLVFEFKEPNGKIVKNKQKIKLIDNGRALKFDGQYKVIHFETLQEGEGWKFQIEKLGKDNNRPSTIRQEIVYTNKTLVVTKSVKYNNTETFFQRNQYKLWRNKEDIGMPILSEAVKLERETNNWTEKDFIGCWTDSREENDANSTIRIFRPCKFKKFPRSRFRFTMYLNEDSTCSWLTIAPNDAHKMEKGVWKFNNKNNSIECYNAENKLTITLKISAVGEDILKLKSK